MAEFSRKNPRFFSALEGGIVLLCAVILILILLPGEERINELYVVPDSVEYGTGAANFAETGEYFIYVGHSRYPPMYPFGFALFQYPFLKLTGAEPANTRFGLVFAAIAAVILLYFTTRSLAGRLAGSIAAVMLAASPAVAIYGRIPMAETLFIFVLISMIALGVAFCRVRRAFVRDLCLVGLGAAVGLGVSIRLNAILHVLPVAVMIFIRERRRPSRMFLDAGFLFIGLAPFVLAIAAFNRSHYGSFSRSGYAYWASYIHDDPDKVWGSDYAFGGSYNRAGVPNATHALKSILSLATPPRPRAFKAVWIVGILILALAVFGALVFRRRFVERGPPELERESIEIDGERVKHHGHSDAFTWLLLVAGTNLLLSVIMIFYFYQDERFHLSWLPVVFIFTGIGFAGLLKSSSDIKLQPLLSYALPAFAAAVIFAYLFSATYQAAKYAVYRPMKMETIRAYEGLVEDEAVIISDLYGPYISYWLIRNTGREHVPYSWGRSRQYVMPLKPARTPGAEYEWALQLLPKSVENKQRVSGARGEVFPVSGRPDTTDEAVALGAEPLYNFAAATSPELIREQLARGRPVYFDTLWLHGFEANLPEDKITLKKKEVERILGVDLEEVARPAGRPLYRLRLTEEE